MSFPRYAKYKDSGVDWLGELPRHWGISAVKRCYRVTLGKMLQTESNGPDDEYLPYLRAANIQWNGVDTSDIKKMWFSKRDRVQLRLERGDLLVSEGGEVGRSCLWAAELENCYFQNSVNRVRANEGQSNRYLYYWMSTMKDKGYIDVLCNKSTIAHFTAEKVAAVPVPAPPLAEQTLIAAFLDRETAKIDELVAEQRRLIELLREKRQAVISHAVTKGLNPHAPMKPSGIEWLGDVPAAWEVMPLKRLIADGTSISYGIVQPGEPLEDGVPFVQTTNMTKGAFDLENLQKTSQAIAAQFPRSCLVGGEVILGIRASIGAAHVVPQTLAGANLSRGVARIVPNHKIASRYLVAYFGTGAVAQYWQISKQGSTFNEVSIDTVRELPVSVPSREEQAAITFYLDAELGRFDTLTAEAQRAIDLLEERRTALISAAVTGQIDIRTFAEREAA